MTRMKSVFAVLLLTAIASVAPQAHAQTVKVVLAGQLANLEQDAVPVAVEKAELPFEIAAHNRLKMGHGRFEVTFRIQRSRAIDSAGLAQLQAVPGVLCLAVEI